MAAGCMPGVRCASIWGDFTVNTRSLSGREYVVLALFRSAYQFEGSVVSREKRTEAETELNWQNKTETRKHQTLFKYS